MKRRALRQWGALPSLHPHPRGGGGGAWTAGQPTPSSSSDSGSEGLISFHPSSHGGAGEAQVINEAWTEHGWGPRSSLGSGKGIKSLPVCMQNPTEKNDLESRGDGTDSFCLASITELIPFRPHPPPSSGGLWEEESCSQASLTKPLTNTSPLPLHCCSPPEGSHHPSRGTQKHSFPSQEREQCAGARPEGHCSLRVQPGLGQLHSGYP